MIKVIFIINEEDGAIRFRGVGENIGDNPPTPMEVDFTEKLMLQVNVVTGPYTKTKDKVPLTIIKWRDKKDEHPNRS